MSKEKETKHEKMQELQNEIEVLENQPPHRDTPGELARERIEEVKRQFKYLTEEPGAIAWGKKFPEKLEADLERLKKEVSGLKVAKKAEKPEKAKKDEEPEEPKEKEKEKPESEKEVKKEKNKSKSKKK